MHQQFCINIADSSVVRSLLMIINPLFISRHQDFISHRQITVCHPTHPISSLYIYTYVCVCVGGGGGIKWLPSLMMKSIVNEFSPYHVY